MKKNRKLWIVSAALVAVVLVAALCLLLPRLQVEPGVPKSGAIVRQEAAEDGRQLFVLERALWTNVKKTVITKNLKQSLTL